MVKRRYIVAGLVLILGIWAVIHFIPTEEKRVKKQFRLLAECVAKDPEENPITMLRKTKSIGALFDEKCEIKAPGYSFSGIFTPEEIRGYAATGRLHFHQLQLKLYDFTIAFPEKKTAKVVLTAKLAGRLNNGEIMEEAHELECLLTKVQKKWLINRFEVVEVLKR